MTPGNFRKRGTGGAIVCHAICPAIIAECSVNCAVHLYIGEGNSIGSKPVYDVRYKAGGEAQCGEVEPLAAATIDVVLISNAIANIQQQAGAENVNVISYSTPSRTVE